MVTTSGSFIARQVDGRWFQMAQSHHLSFYGQRHVPHVVLSTCTHWLKMVHRVSAKQVEHNHVYSVCGNPLQLKYWHPPMQKKGRISSKVQSQLIRDTSRSKDEAAQLQYEPQCEEKGKAMEDVEVKEEEDMGGSSSSMLSPKPMEGLHDAGPPPFLTKTFDMVEDPATDSIVSWSQARNSFIVWDSQKLSTNLLPKYFKHSNFSSFIRQLNTYGFKKVDPDRWEFANEGFLGGQKHLLKRIKRRKNAPQTIQQQQEMAACVELERFTVEGDVDQLRRDRNVLMVEIVKLRQQQQTSRAQLVSMEERWQGTERRHQYMMAFLARALRNPTFVQQLILRRNQNKELAGIGRKRRLTSRATSSENVHEVISQLSSQAAPRSDQPAQEEMGIESLFSTIDNSTSSSNRNQNAETIASSCYPNMDSGNDINWEELLNEGLIVGEEDGEDQNETLVEVDDLADKTSGWGNDVQLLVEQMGFLGSKA